MKLTGDELKQLAPSIVLMALLLAAGAALIWYTGHSHKAALQQLAASRTERSQNRERLSKIAEEEREVREKLEVYRRLKDTHVLGEERRLEWADAVSRIRKQRELIDVRYRVEAQRLLVSLPGKPANVDFYTSTMKVNMALLHEGDLLAFLDDLRASGNAFYAVQRCALTRLGQGIALTTLAPRLRAECAIELITIMDRGAKT